MIGQGGRAIGRLTQSNLQCLGGRRAALSSSSIERVANLHNSSQNQHILHLALKGSLLTPVARRTYADQPVSRPKAHTGRTTAAARKAPTTSKTKAAKKPAPKTKAPKALPKTKSLAKPKPKPKPKPAKKVKAKPKRKALTEQQKKSATIKELKLQGLTPPHQLPRTAWQVLAFTNIKPNETRERGTAMKRLGVEFRNMTPEQLEQLNHTANQNRAINEKNYRQWIESHTPEAIYQANFARRALNRQAKVRCTLLRDHRQVKRPATPWVVFFTERWATGDLKGIKVTEASKLASREWKGLSASEKQPYEDAAKEDRYRFAQEVRTVYNRDVKPDPRKKKAA